MRHLKSTVKWEIRKWLAYVLPPALAVLVIWPILWVLPVLLGEQSDFLRSSTQITYVILGIAVALVVKYMAFIYPLLSIVGYAFMPTNFTEHGSGRPFAVVLAVRLVVAALTYSLGVGILIVTLFLLRGIGWGFAETLIAGPSCRYGAYGSCLDYVGALCTCEASLMPLIIDLAMFLPWLVVMLPAVFLHGSAASSTKKKDKWVVVSSIASYVWVALIFQGYITGVDIPTSIIFVIYPIVFLILSCRLIDHNCDIYGVIFK